MNYVISGIIVLAAGFFLIPLLIRVWAFALGAGLKQGFTSKNTTIDRSNDNEEEE